jgi:hypothetical protein
MIFDELLLGEKAMSNSPFMIIAMRRNYAVAQLSL